METSRIRKAQNRRRGHTPNPQTARSEVPTSDSNEQKSEPWLLPMIKNAVSAVAALYTTRTPEQKPEHRSNDNERLEAGQEWWEEEQERRRRAEQEMRRRIEGRKKIEEEQHEKEKRQQERDKGQQEREKRQLQNRCELEMNKAMQLYLKDMYVKGILGLSKVLEEVGGPLGSADPFVLDLKEQIARGQLELGDFRAAESLMEDVLSTRKLNPDWGTRKDQESALLLAECCLKSEKAGEAIELCSEILRVLPASPSDLRGKVDETLGKICSLQRDLGKVGGHLENFLREREKDYGPDDPETASLVQHLGTVRLGQRRLDDAEDLYLRAWIVRAVALGGWDPETLTTLHAYGSLLVLRSRPEEAELLLTETLRGRSVHGDALAIETVATDLENLFRQQSNTKKLQILQKCKNFTPEDLQTQEPQYMQDVAEIVERISGNKRRFTLTGKYLDRISKDLCKRLGENSAKYMRTIRALAVLHWVQGNHFKAHSIAEQALGAYNDNNNNNHKNSINDSESQAEMLLLTADLAIILSADTKNKARVQKLSQDAMFGLEDAFSAEDYRTVSCKNRLAKFGLTHWDFTSLDPPFMSVRELGGGTFAVVSEVHRSKSGKKYAQKRVRLSPNAALREHISNVIENEIDNLKKVLHPHIVRVECTYREKNFFTIILNPVADKNLEVFLYQQNKQDKHRLDRERGRI